MGTPLIHSYVLSAELFTRASNGCFVTHFFIISSQWELWFNDSVSLKLNAYSFVKGTLIIKVKYIIYIIHFRYFSKYHTGQGIYNVYTEVCKLFLMHHLPGCFTDIVRYTAWLSGLWCFCRFLWFLFFIFIFFFLFLALILWSFWLYFKCN